MSSIQQITIHQPDDWHLHLRDGEMMQTVLPYSSKYYGKAIVMPNLVPPLKHTADIMAYRERILAVLPNDHQFEPLMTAYLADDTNIDDLVTGHQQGIIKAVKYYPANATTNSAHGVTSLTSVYHVLEAMQQHGIPLLLHGETTNPTVDIFDREAYFIDNTLLPLLKDFPELKIVLEHASTKQAAQIVLEGPKNLAATITPQHLLLNRNALFKGGLRPHNYCLPILKREVHRDYLVKAVTSGCERFFLGTDSAPHEQGKKECGCGCAGAFNAEVALPIYADIFDQAGALSQLEKFTSINGANFYGLAVNTTMITLIKQPHIVATEIDLPNGGKLIPFLAGETLPWSIKKGS